MDDCKPKATSALPSSARNTHGLLRRVVKSEAKAIVAERLLAARELNGYSQTEAAEKIGYATPAQLSQWEQCRRQPPMHMLMRASSAYRVSMDYLTGISPEPDRDPAAEDRRHVVKASQEMFAGASDALAELILGQMKTGGPAVEVAVRVLEEGEKFHRALARFIDLNRKAFEEDMRGSAPLLGMHERFEKNCLEQCRALLDRFKFVNASAKKTLLKKFRPADMRSGDMFNQPDA